MMIELGIAAVIGLFTWGVYKLGYAAGWDAAMVRSCQIMQKHGGRPGDE